MRAQVTKLLGINAKDVVFNVAVELAYVLDSHRDICAVAIDTAATPSGSEVMLKLKGV